jgi:uncharacterized protein
VAKFKFIYWLVEFLSSNEEFIFDWNDGNSLKSKKKHDVTTDMIESAFGDNSLLALGEQYQPMVNEERYGVIAQSLSGPILFICFTIREGRIRPISARPASKKERSIYDS